MPSTPDVPCLAGSITKGRFDLVTDRLASRLLSCGSLCPLFSLSQLYNFLAGLSVLAIRCIDITPGSETMQQQNSSRTGESWSSLNK